MSAAINREIYRFGAEEGQAYAITIGGPRPLGRAAGRHRLADEGGRSRTSPPVQPTIVGFYGPAALALVLQHMAVTLIALSIVRERASGALDRFRSSPMRATEVVAGKVAGVRAARQLHRRDLRLAARVRARRADARGARGRSRSSSACCSLASLGLGLLISVVSDSERQAVQLSLLTLLASMFFSGFVLRISEFQPAVQVAAYALPVTHGISLLQELCSAAAVTPAVAARRAAGIAGVLLVSSWVLLRRELRPQ